MNNPFTFLITQLFQIYVYIILLRFFLQLVRADFYNPFSQFIVKATNPILLPMRKLIPGIGGMDNASLVFAYLVNLAKFLILMTLGLSPQFGFGFLLVFNLLQLLSLALGLFIFLAFIRVILSWINPHSGSNPMMHVMFQLTEPLLSPIRRVIPPMGMIDFSTFILIVGLVFLQQSVEYFLYPLARLFN